MKIYLIGQKGIPAKFGGVEKHVEKLATKLVEKGHEVFAYTRPNYTDKKLKEYRGVKLISLPSIYSKNLDAITHTLFATIDVIFRKADIIHFHSIGPSSLIWLLKMLKPRTPIISTFHSQCYHHQKWGKFARIYLKFGEKMACTKAKELITVSKFLQSYAKDKYQRAAKYIPNGVDIPTPLPAKEISERWGLEKDSYFLTVSRLVKHKGIHYIIEAYNNLKTDKKLVIVGDGAFTDSYVDELRAQTNNNPNIILTGNQSGDILNELFSNAYLFIQASEDEGLSIALLEALSFGLPVLVSDIPANLETVRNIGFIFKNKDQKSLEDKLRYLVQSSETLEEKRGLGIALMQTEYNWDNITNDVIEVYYEALKKN
jgi:glycosyltransferase involved in cell wall biosynthesis